MLNALEKLDEQDTYVGETLEALSGVDLLETIGDALVHLGVGLRLKKVSKSNLFCRRANKRRASPKM